VSIYVFLGPTLPLSEARQILEANYLPPVSAGDICSLMLRAGSPRAIAIIDGLFERVPAVWHKEILFALSQGVHVYGSSSMGALRAAELAPFGMRGVGRIFEAYRSGELEDDDEVAVNHAPAEFGYAATSEAMVNLRYGLEQAERAGRISARTRELLVSFAKAKFYFDRSWDALFQAAPQLGIEAPERGALEDWVRRERPDLKRADAIALLEQVAETHRSEVEPHSPNFDFEPTKFWLDLVESVKPSTESEAEDGFPMGAVTRHVRLFRPDRSELLREALVFHLLEREARRAELEVPQTIRSAKAEELAAHRAGLGSHRFARLVELESLAGVVEQSQTAALDRLLPLALARAGRLGEVLAEVESKRRFLRDNGLDPPSVAQAGVSLEQLLAWYGRHSGLPASSVQEYATRLGFESGEQLLEELLAHYLFEKGLT